MNHENRDSKLGNALLELDTPTYRSDFFTDLQRQLSAEPAPFASHSYRFPRRAAISATVTSIAAGVVAVAIVSGVNQTPSPQQPLAVPTSQVTETTQPMVLVSRVVAQIAENFTDLRTLRGEVDEVLHPIPGLLDQETRTHTNFLLRDDGSFLIEGSEEDATWIDSYLSTTKTFRNFDNTDAATIYEVRNAPPMRPTRAGTVVSLASAIRSLQAANDPKLTEITFEGKPAWRVEASISNETDHSPDHIVIIADRSTAFPIRVETTRQGQPLRELSASNVERNPSVNDQDFVIPLNGKRLNTSPSPIDNTREVSITEAASLASYGLIEPTWMPEGFTLSSIYFTDQQIGANYEHRDRLRFIYRNGMSAIEVLTTKAVTSSTPIDPLDGRDETQKSMRVSLNQGFFANERAEQVTSLLFQPHLWGFKGKVVFGVTGDASPVDMTRIAESLQTH